MIKIKIPSEPNGENKVPPCSIQRRCKQKHDLRWMILWQLDSITDSIYFIPFISVGWSNPHSRTFKMFHNRSSASILQKKCLFAGNSCCTLCTLLHLYTMVSSWSPVLRRGAIVKPSPRVVECHRYTLFLSLLCLQGIVGLCWIEFFPHSAVMGTIPLDCQQKCDCSRGAKQECQHILQWTRVHLQTRVSQSEAV